ncbi:MAG: hypothetical protein QW404_01085 [Candidatus Nanoarchaeia archaeon]
MPERINSVDDTCIINSKDGKKWLCKLIYVAELEKRTMGKGIVHFDERERDDLLSRSLEKLRKHHLEPDFYFEKWPQTDLYDKDAYLVQPPVIYLSIQFYKKILPINEEPLRFPCAGSVVRS